MQFLHNGKWHEGPLRTRTIDADETFLLNIIFSMSGGNTKLKRLLVDSGFVDRATGLPYGPRNPTEAREVEEYWCEGAWYEGSPLTREAAPDEHEMASLLVSVALGDTSRLAEKMEQWGFMKDGKVDARFVNGGCDATSISGGTFTGVLSKEEVRVLEGMLPPEPGRNAKHAEDLAFKSNAGPEIKSCLARWARDADILDHLQSAVSIRGEATISRPDRGYVFSIGDSKSEPHLNLRAAIEQLLKGKK